MNLSQLIKRIGSDFILITTGILFCHIIFCLVLVSDARFTVNDLIKIPAAAAITAALGIIFYSRKELSKKQWLFRSIIHLTLLETTVLLLAKPFGWFDTGSLIEYALLFVLVFIIYALVLFLGWRNDAAAAERINQALKDIPK